METKITQIVIPDDVSYADLNFSRGENGEISIDWDPIKKICEASDMPYKEYRELFEGHMPSLVITLYKRHRRYGGDLDQSYEQAIEEMKALNKKRGLV